jgi:hypothetical protein
MQLFFFILSVDETKTMSENDEFILLYSKLYHKLVVAETVPELMEIVDVLTGGVGLPPSISGFAKIHAEIVKMMRRLMKPNSKRQVVHTFLLMLQ